MPEYTVLINRLETIETILRSWRKFNTDQRGAEGLGTNLDTAIMTPPTWPTHDMILRWEETLADARNALTSVIQGERK